MGKNRVDGSDCFSYLFHGLPTMTLYFGEPTGVSVASEMLRRDVSADLVGLDLPRQKSLAAGLYPVMVKRFGILFGHDLDAEGLFDFLASQEAEADFTYETAFCSPAMYSRFFKELTERAGLRNGLAADIDGDRACWFPVTAGHGLTVIHFSLGRLDGKTAVA